MRRKKTISLLALVFSVSFILASCGKPHKTETSSEQGTTSVSQPVSETESKSESTSTPVSSSEKENSSSEAAAPTLTNLQVDVSGVKTTYELGEDFDATGIKVTGTLTEKGVSKEVTYNASDLLIDSSSFNKNLANYYTITVAPKDFGSVTATYSVSVYGQLQATAKKTVFALKEEFSTEGLTLSYYRGVDNSGKEVRSELKLKSVKIDSSSYNAAKLGSYEIKISYEIDTNKTLTTSYTVEVQSKVSGLSLSKTTTKYSLDGSLTTTIAIDDLVVCGVDQYGLVEETPLTSSEYTLSYYKDGTTKIDSLENVGAGIYQIWAERQVTLYGETYTVSDFVIVYVNDPLNSIALASDESIVLSQEEGADSISSTWKFNLTYASGAIKTVEASDVTITGLDTRTVAASAEAGISYVGTDSDGTKYTVTTTVTYTITAAAPSEDEGLGYKAKSYSRMIGEGDVATGIAEETFFISDEENGNYVSVLATADKTVDIDGNNCTYGDHSFTHRVKLGGAGSTTYKSIKIVVSREATFRTWLKTGSSKETRSLALYDSTGTIIEGTATPASGSDVAQMEVTIQAGTYYVFGEKACNVYGFELDTTVPKKAVAKSYSRMIGEGDVATGISSELSLISDEENGNYVSVLATADKTVDIDGNNCTYGEHSFTHRVKLGGAGSTTYKSLKIVVARESTFRTWLKTGSSKEIRSLALYDSTGTIIEGTATPASGSDVAQMEVTIQAGTYYVFGEKACNVYGVEIDTTIIE